MVKRHRVNAGAWQKDAGVTLVELLVTMVIAGLVTSSTFLFFAGQKQVYETQTKLLNIQQNLWAAMETITRNLRAAGTGMVGCVRPDSDGIGADNGDPPPVSGPGNTPPATGLRAFVNAALVNATPFYGTGAARIAPLWIQNGANGAPDAIIVAYGVGTSGNFADARLASTVPVGTPRSTINTAAGLTTAFRNNEFIVLVDNTAIPLSGNFDRGCTLLQIVGITAGTNLLDTLSAGSLWNPTANLAPMVPFAYDATNAGIRNFGQLNWVRFAINAPVGGTPVLEMTRLDNPTLPPQTLAEGIEDLQVAFACDLRGAAVGTPADGTLIEDPSTLDEWTYNIAGDVPPVNGCNRPQAIRVTLLARSLAPDENLRGLPNNRKPAVEDGIPGAFDMFRHRTISTTVFPRN
ncbi:MAG: PilW family protein [Deltaproteobacteria bacterium]|nr:PilW family protein [Deltaproteobacteria bacterium]